MSAPKAALAGLGITDLGKVYGRTAPQLGAQAVRRAAADAGLAMSDIDGLLISGGISDTISADNAMTLALATDLDLRDLSLLTVMEGFGSTAVQMVQYAAMAIQAGSATTVALVWADAPLQEARGAGAAYAIHAGGAKGWRAITKSGGALTANNEYALAARRHMDRFGTTSEQLGAIAVAQRDWAVLNPLAQMRVPITLEDHQASRMISDPLRLLDCCLVSNGAIAVIVTSAERAEALRQPAVGVYGWAQSHPGRSFRRNDDFGIVSGAAESGPRALAMAGLGIADIDVTELYDCYTFTALLTLEDYGFCEKGEGGPFVAQPGVLGPKGTLKLNTGGGQLSSYYMWGMTPLSEAIIQARGQAGERQVERHDRVLVSGNGGLLDFHATLVIGTI
jgi:acetyl-CoA acetyltransferase